MLKHEFRRHVVATRPPIFLKWLMEILTRQAGREARGLARHVGWPEVVEQRRRLFFQATGNGTVLELENEMLSTQLTELFDYRRRASNHRPAFMAEVGMRGNKTHRNRQLDDKIYFIWVL